MKLILNRGSLITHAKHGKWHSTRCGATVRGALVEDGGPDLVTCKSCRRLLGLPPLEDLKKGVDIQT